MMVIYTITNLVNGKKYVGQTTQEPMIRWSRHKREALNYNSTQAIHCAIRKYGIINFRFDVIDTDVNSIDSLNESEIEWISHYDTFEGDGYNMTSGGEGCIVSEEAKRNMSNAQKGKTHSEETKRKIGLASKGNNSNLDKIVSEETREKISKANMGRIVSLETRVKIGNAHRGKIVSEETREKIRQSLLGHKHTDETKQKVSEAVKGRITSDETKIKMQSNSQCKPILQLTITGKFITEHHSINGAARTTGILRTAINNALAKKSGLSYSGGFIWRYKSDFTEEQLIRMISEINLTM